MSELTGRSYCQLAQRQVELLKQPRGSRPVFDLDLQSHEHVVGIAHHWTVDVARRETVDHHAVLWVLVDLRGPVDG